MEHQERALGAYVEQVKGEPGTLGVVVVGSVARGEEREDSDVDVYLVVDADRFAELAAADRWAWVDRVGLDYPGSYIDVKATDLAYLRAAAERGDDPTRASFVGARVAYGAVDGLEELVAAIPRLPERGWDGRIASHVAQAHLHGGYFLRQAEERGDAFLLHHATTHLTMAAARAALAAAQVLMPARSTSGGWCARSPALRGSSRPGTRLWPSRAPRPRTNCSRSSTPGSARVRRRTSRCRSSSATTSWPCCGERSPRSTSRARLKPWPVRFSRLAGGASSRVLGVRARRRGSECRPVRRCR